MFIWYLTADELMDGKEIIRESKNYTGKRKEFDLDKDVIVDLCNSAIQFFVVISDF
jgi:hypothetical protein